MWSWTLTDVVDQVGFKTNTKHCIAWGGGAGRSKVCWDWGFSSTPHCQSHEASIILRAADQSPETRSYRWQRRNDTLADRFIFIRTHELPACMHMLKLNTHRKTHIVTASQPPERQQRPGNTLQMFNTVCFLTFLGQFWLKTTTQILMCLPIFVGSL